MGLSLFLKVRSLLPLLWEISQAKSSHSKRSVCHQEFCMRTKKFRFRSCSCWSREFTALTNRKVTDLNVTFFCSVKHCYIIDNRQLTFLLWNFTKFTQWSFTWGWKSTPHKFHLLVGHMNLLHCPPESCLVTYLWALLYTSLHWQ